MPGYVIHIVVAQEYCKKNNIKNYKKVIEGTIHPDFANDKSQTHYGKSPAYTNLLEFLKHNEINNEFNKGFFLHLITDYLFYNKYLTKLVKPQIYNDYDFLNKQLIEKYKVILPESVKDKVFFKEGLPKIINLEMVDNIINEVSNLNLEEVITEIKSGDKKWSTYKNIV